MKALLVSIVLAFGCQVADAQPLDAGVMLTDAGPAAASAERTVKPSDRLSDPMSSPQQAYNDLVAAKRLGWSLLVLAILIMITRLAGKLGGYFKPLASGRTAVVVAAVSTLAIAMYNALALGGTWMSAAAAALVAFAVYWNSHAGPPPVPKQDAGGN